MPIITIEIHKDGAHIMMPNVRGPLDNYSNKLKKEKK